MTERHPIPGPRKQPAPSKHEHHPEKQAPPKAPQVTTPRRGHPASPAPIRRGG